MTISTIFFDESHNTGANLLDANQPVFTLASVDYNPDECSELLLLVSSHQASEAKFSSLQSSEAGRRKILEFANKLQDAGIERFVFGAIGPQDLEYLMSDDLKNSDNDINPADYMTKFCL